MDGLDDVHPDSELAAAARPADAPALARLRSASRSVYEFYEAAVRELAVHVEKNALRRRIAHFLPIENVSDEDLLPLLMLIEAQRRVLPVGRPWESEGRQRLVAPVVVAPPAPVVVPVRLPVVAPPRWRRWFATYKHAEEVEVRFKNVCGTAFGNIFEMLVRGPFYMVNEQLTVEIISNDRRRVRRRDGTTVELKQRLDYVDECEYVVVKSRERVEPDPDDAYLRERALHVRQKNRFAFLTPHDTTRQDLRHLVNLEISLSAVLVDDAVGPRYEVELEMKNSVRVDNVQKSIDTVLGWMADPRGYGLPREPSSRQRPPRARQVLPLVRRERCLRLLTQRCLATLKFDGVRHFLHAEPRRGLTLVSLDGHATRIGDPYVGGDAMVIDCEVFFCDVIRVFTFDTTDARPFEERLTALEQFHARVSHAWTTFSFAQVYMKTFSVVNDTDQLADACDQAMVTSDCDGVVVNCGAEDVYKWKPASLQTVDVLVVSETQEWPDARTDARTDAPSSVAYSCAIDAKGRPALVRVRGPNGDDCLLHYDPFVMGLPSGVRVDNLIVECLVNFPAHVAELLNGSAEPTPVVLTPVRIRFSKRKPNPTAVVGENMRLAVGSLDARALRGLDLPMARHVLHDFKSSVLARLPRDATLLDVGSGRGADADKWRSLSVIAVEPNASAAEALRRAAPCATVYEETVEHFLTRDVAFTHVTFFSSLAHVDYEAVLRVVRDRGAQCLLLFQEGDDLVAGGSHFSAERDGDRLRLRLNRRGAPLLVNERCLSEEALKDYCTKLGYCVTAHRLSVPPMTSGADREWLATYRFVRLIL